MKYEEWKARVDLHLLQKTGLTVGDCTEERQLHDAYDYNETPEEFVDRVIKKYKLQEIK
jgi:hypothetical protein